VTLAASCHLTLGIDGLELVDETAGGGGSIATTSANGQGGGGGPPLECQDELQNGAETDVDCGGPECDPCANDDSCMMQNDCASFVCESGTCRSCSEHTDCTSERFCEPVVGGEHHCVPDRALGEACLEASECPGGWCVDGVCCDTECNRMCETCFLDDATKGECTPAPAGEDPDDECVFMGDCRLGNGCSGAAGACGPADGEACDNGVFCDGNDLCAGGACEGTGNPCPGHDSTPNCRDSCNETAEACTADDENGTPCNEDGDLTMGICQLFGVCAGD
jgi:hypothetical protein